MRRKLTCPESAHLEDVEFHDDPESGTILGVTACSAFTPADAVECDQECIRRLNQRLLARVNRHGAAVGAE